MRLSLLAFQDRLLGCHVLIRSDSTVATAYLDRQARVRSRCSTSWLRRYTYWLILASCRSLQPTCQVASIVGPTFVTGQTQSDGVVLHPQVVQQIWDRFGRARVDLL